MGSGPALHGFGDERPPGAELGASETKIGELKIGRDVVEADIDVVEVDRPYGDPPIIRADFGGTSGGVEPDLNLVNELLRTGSCACGTEAEGIKRGARILGDRGCFGEPCRMVPF